MEQYISPAEASQWLNDRRITESPYLLPAETRYCKQYKIPKSPFVSELVNSLDSFSEGLLVWTDWIFYHPDDWKYYPSKQLLFVQMIRDIAEKAPSSDKSIGVVYGAGDREKLISHLEESIKLGWSVYFYPDKAKTTIYLWEGALMDVWSDSRKFMSKLEKTLENVSYGFDSNNQKT